MELTRLLDYMEMESIRRGSQMSTDEANALAKRITLHVSRITPFP